MNAFAPQGRRPCLLWSQVECVNVLVLIDNGELREFYELGGSRLIIGELLELGMRLLLKVAGRVSYGAR